MAILISFAKGYSDTRELLGCCGSANWYMLSEVWYSRKGFFWQEKGDLFFEVMDFQTSLY